MLHGILNVYKEKGFTSFDVVAILRGISGQKKIGHTGTLDPDAQGVLPVCFGKGTKVCSLLTDWEKTYEALFLLGKTTDTQDSTGQIIKERDASHVTEEMVKKTIESFVGTYDQIPPMFSAVWVDGRRLYELARQGRTIERKPRKVTVKSIQILEMKLLYVTMEVTCSKGTYIRTLCHDIGEVLGTGACLEDLKRTEVGLFTIEESLTIDEIRRAADQGKLEQLLFPVDGVFPDRRKYVIGEEDRKFLENGNPLTFRGEKEEYSDGEELRVYDPDGSFTALYRYDKSSGRLQVVKMFVG